MKRGVIYTIVIIIILLLALQVKMNLEKPKIIYEQSPDHDDIVFNELNDGFLIEKGNTGILLIHGLGATPYQTKPLASFLSDKNITVYSVRLKGHGTTLYELESSTKEDWYSDVEVAYNELKEKTNRTYVLGISAGASLALILASNYDVDGVIAIATPIYLASSNSKYIHILKFFKKYYYFGVDNTQIGYAYENLPTKTVSEFMSLIKESKSIISNIDEPILIIQSNKDNTVRKDSAEYLFDNVLSEDKEILWVDEIEHAIIREYESDTDASLVEREKVFNIIYGFLK